MSVSFNSLTSGKLSPRMSPFTAQMSLSYPKSLFICPTVLRSMQILFAAGQDGNPRTTLSLPSHNSSPSDFPIPWKMIHRKSALSGRSSWNKAFQKFCTNSLS